MNTRWMIGHEWTVLDVRRAERMGYSDPDVVHDCVLMKADFPTERLCAADEWWDILADWMREALARGDIDRFFRLNAIMNRCNAETTF